MHDAGGATARFAAALTALDEELDWELLGNLYCDEGGESFFPPEQRDAIQDAGLHVAGDLGEALDALRGSGPGRSLYFGAAVAELAPVLFETVVLGRKIVWRNLPGPEADELNRALAAIGAALSLPLPRVGTQRLGDEGSFDHIWCVSVLTDPDAFPALHDELYERRRTELAVGGGDRRRERRRAEHIVADLVARARVPALISTTDEELPFFEAAAAARELALHVTDRGRLSGIVGDVIRLARLGR